MKTTKMLTILVLALALILCQARVGEAAPMGTAFTYQGRLIDANSAADGLYDFEFKLFDDPCTGTQQGGTIDINDLDVIDGYFTVELDFGDPNVFPGDARWLETTVAHADGSDPCTLRPRQELTPVPYALQTRGMFVDNAGNVGIGTLSPTEKLEVDGIVKAKGFEGSSLITSIKVPADLEITMEPVDNPGVFSYLDVFKTGGAPIFSLSEAGNVIVGGDAFVKGKVGIGAVAGPYKLDVSGNVTASRYYDRDNTAYYLDPASTSNLNAVYASSASAYTFYDRNNTGYYLDPASTSICNDMRASIFYDRDNTAYYLNPAGVSYCSDMRANIFYDRQNTSYYVDPANTGTAAKFAGNVGIGTTGPAYKLDVSGTMRASGDVFFEDNLKVGAPGIALSGKLHVDGAGWNKAIYVTANSAIDYGIYVAQGNSYFYGNVYAPRYYDRNNTIFYVDPAGDSICNDMRASIFRDRDSTGYYVDPASFSRLYNVRVWDGSASVDYATGSGELYVERDLEVDGRVYVLDAYLTNHGLSGREARITSDGRLGTGVSSKRYKEQIVPLEDDFSKILGAQPVAFLWKESKEPDIGLIAEDMDELGLRNLVFYDAEGRPESVHYRLVSLYLLEVLKDQASSIKELKAENESLKKQLRAENQSVKQRLDAVEETIQQLAKAKEVQL